MVADLFTEDLGAQDSDEQSQHSDEQSQHSADDNSDNHDPQESSSEDAEDQDNVDKSESDSDTMEHEGDGEITVRNRPPFKRSHDTQQESEGPKTETTETKRLRRRLAELEEERRDSAISLRDLQKKGRANAKTLREEAKKRKSAEQALAAAEHRPKTRLTLPTTYHYELRDDTGQPFRPPRTSSDTLTYIETELTKIVKSGNWPVTMDQTVPLRSVNDAEVYLARLDQASEEMFDDRDAIARINAVLLMLRATIDRNTTMYSSLKPQDQTINSAIIKTLCRAKLEFVKLKGTLDRAYKWPSPFPSHDLQTADHLRQMKVELTALVKFHGVPRHMHFRFVKQVIDDAKATKTCHPSVYPAAAKLKQLVVNRPSDELQLYSVNQTIDLCEFSTISNVPIPAAIIALQADMVEHKTLAQAFSAYEAKTMILGEDLSATVNELELSGIQTLELIIHQLKSAHALKLLPKEFTNEFANKCHDNKVTYKTVCDQEGSEKALKFLRDYLAKVDLTSGLPDKDTKANRGTDAQHQSTDETVQNKETKKSKAQADHQEKLKRACDTCKKLKGQRFHNFINNKDGVQIACPREPTTKAHKEKKEKFLTTEAGKKKLAPKQ